MAAIDEALENLSRAITKRIEFVAPFRAIVTGSTVAGLVTIRRLEAVAADTEEYARLVGCKVRINDEVICLRIEGNPVIVGVNQRALATPTISLDANAGSGATQTPAGTDREGQIEVVTGTGPMAGILCSLNFAATKPSLNYAVLLTPATNAAADLSGQVNVTGRSTTKFDLNLRIAPAASSIYRWFFIVREYDQ